MARPIKNVPLVLTQNMDEATSLNHERRISSYHGISSMHSRCSIGGSVQRRLRRVIADEFQIQVSMRTNSESKRNRKTNRRRRDFGDQSERSSAIPPARQTHRVKRGDRVPWANASAPQTPSPYRCHGSGASAHVQENTNMDRRAVAFACISFACVFAGLES